MNQKLRAYSKKRNTLKIQFDKTTQKPKRQKKNIRNRKDSGYK